MRGQNGVLFSQLAGTEWTDQVVQLACIVGIIVETDFRIDATFIF